MSPIDIPIPPPSPLVDPLPEEFIAPPPPVIGYPMSPSGVSNVQEDPRVTGGDPMASQPMSIEDRITRLEGQFGGLNNQFSNINSLISGPFSGGYGSSYGNNPFGYSSRQSFSPFGQSPFGQLSPFSQSPFSSMLYGGVGGFMPYFG
tara:strand:- start:828 stop:1268 length:441 start_codon:yes stop_codon:yes gene_type:complete